MAPLTAEQIRALKEHMARRGLMFHEQRSQEYLYSRLVDPFRVSNPVEAIQNKRALRRAFRASRKEKLQDTYDTLASLPPEISGQMTVDHETGMSQLTTDLPTLKNTFDALYHRDLALNTAQNAGAAERFGRSVLGGAIDAGANIFDITIPLTDINLRDQLLKGVDSVFNTDKAAGFRDFQTEFAAHQQGAGTAGQIGAGIGALIPFLAVGGAVGAGVRGAAARKALEAGLAAPRGLSMFKGTVLPFMTAGAITAPSGQALRGGISGALAGYAGHFGANTLGKFISSRGTALIASRMTPRMLRTAMEGAPGVKNALTRFNMNILIPEASELMGEFMAFGTLNAIEQYWEHGKIDWNVVLGVNAGIIGILKGARLGRAGVTGFKPQKARGERVMKIGQIFTGRSSALKPEVVEAKLAEYVSPMEVAMGRAVGERARQDIPMDSPFKLKPEGRPLYGTGTVPAPGIDRVKVGPGRGYVDSPLRDRPYYYAMGLDPYLAKIAQIEAEFMIEISPEAARTAIFDPEEALRMIGAENPTLFTEKQYADAQHLKTKLREAGLVVELKPVYGLEAKSMDVPLPEMQMMIDELGKVAMSKQLGGDRQGAEETLAMIERLKKDSNPIAVFGVMEAVLAKIDELGRFAQAKRGTKAAENALAHIDSLKAKLFQGAGVTPGLEPRGVIRFHEHLRNQARAIREVAKNLPADDPSIPVLNATAARLEMRASIAPDIEARIVQLKAREQMEGPADELDARASKYLSFGPRVMNQAEYSRYVELTKRSEANRLRALGLGEEADAIYSESAPRDFQEFRRNPDGTYTSEDGLYDIVKSKGKFYVVDRNTGEISAESTRLKDAKEWATAAGDADRTQLAREKIPPIRREQAKYRAAGAAQHRAADKVIRPEPVVDVHKTGGHDIIRGVGEEVVQTTPGLERVKMDDSWALVDKRTGEVKAEMGAEEAANRVRGEGDWNVVDAQSGEVRSVAKTAAEAKAAAQGEKWVVVDRRTGEIKAEMDGLQAAKAAAEVARPFTVTIDGQPLRENLPKNYQGEMSGSIRRFKTKGEARLAGKEAAKAIVGKQRTAADMRGAEKAGHDLRARAQAMRKEVIYAREERIKLEAKLRALEAAQPQLLMLKNQQALQEMTAELNELNVRFANTRRGPTPEQILDRLEEAQRVADARIDKTGPRPKEPPEQPAYREGDVSREQAGFVTSEQVKEGRKAEFKEVVEEVKEQAKKKDKDKEDELASRERDDIDAREDEPQVLRRRNMVVGKIWNPKRRLDFQADVMTLLKWKRSGAEGKMPALRSSGKHRRALWAIFQELWRQEVNPKTAADTAAANTFPPNTKGSKILRKGDIEVVAEVLKIMYEMGTGIDPAQEVKINHGERGFIDFGIFGLGGKDKGARTTVVEPPDPYRAAINALGRAHELIEEVKNIATDNGTRDPSGALNEQMQLEGGVSMRAPGVFDRYWQQLHVVRKMIKAPWLEKLVTMIRMASHNWTHRRAINDEWIINGLDLPLAELTKDMTPEQKTDLEWKLIHARVGGNTRGLNAKEIEIINFIHQFYKKYRDVLELWGVGLKPEDTYFTFIRQLADSRKIFKGNEEFQVVQNITSRFTKKRLSENPGGILSELGSVLRIYSAAMERYIQFKPIELAIKEIMWYHGVEGNTRQYKGTQEAKDRGLPQMPAGQAEWWNTQLQIMQGVPGEWSKWMEAKAEWLFEKTVGKVVPERYHPTGQGMFNAWMQFVHVGALGMNLASAVKNLTQNNLTVAEIGGTWWLKGVQELWRARRDGTYEINDLLTEFGVMEQSFTHSTIKDVGGQLASNAGWQQLQRHFSKLADKLFFFFQKAELLNRSIAAIGAYRKAEAIYKAEGVRDPGRLHAMAKSYAMDIVGRTQFDFSRILGGQAFSGSAGRALGQFARFNISSTDYLITIFKRAVGSEEALRRMPMLPGEKALYPVIRYLAASGVLGFFGMNVLGISIDDIEGPAGIATSPAKHAINLAIDTGVNIYSIAGADNATGMGRDPRRLFQGQLFAGKLKKTLGTQTRDQSTAGVLWGSLGPAVGSVHSLAKYLMVPNKAHRQELWKNLWLHVPMGLQLTRIDRAYDEERTGFVRSRATGNRLFPEGRDMTRHEKFSRALGFEPMTLSQEWELISEANFKKEFWNDNIGALRQEAIDRLVDGEKMEDVIGFFAAGFMELTDATNQTITAGEFNEEIKLVHKKWLEANAKTKLEKMRSRVPFRRGTPGPTVGDLRPWTQERAPIR